MDSITVPQCLITGFLMFPSKLNHELFFRVV